MTGDCDQQRRREILLTLDKLHRLKDAAYADAWRKRGELMSIFPNIARKYDRLVVAFEESTPSATDPLGDTAADLCVYSAKYLTWLAEQQPEEFAEAELTVVPDEVSDARGPQAVTAVFSALSDDQSVPPENMLAAWHDVQSAFGALERILLAQQSSPGGVLDYPNKTRSAWRLLVAASWLIVRVDHEQPEAMERFRREVDRMGSTTTA